MKNHHAVFFTSFLACAIAIAGCADQPEEGMDRMDADTAAQQEMGGMAMGEDDMPDSLAQMKLAPLVRGYYEGEEVYFIHTEASDAQVAGMLTEMMGPDVVVVPELARTPEALLSKIYVFENGVQGMGPFGFQPDVFISVPGDEEYRPLVSIDLVSWNDGASPRELRSEADVQGAAERGEITIGESGTVVNAPVLAWPGATR